MDYPHPTHDALVVAVTERGGSVIKSRGQVQDAHASTMFVFQSAEPHAGWMGWSERAVANTGRCISPGARSRLAADGLGIESVPLLYAEPLRRPGPIRGFLAVHRAIEEGRTPFRSANY